MKAAKPVNPTQVSLEGIQLNKAFEDQTFRLCTDRIAEFLEHFMSGSRRMVFRQVERAVETIAKMSKLDQLHQYLTAALSKTLAAQIDSRLFDPHLDVKGLGDFLAALSNFAIVSRSVFQLYEIRHLAFVGYRSFTDFFFEIVKKYILGRPDKLEELLEKTSVLFYQAASSLTGDSRALNNNLVGLYERTGVLGDFASRYVTLTHREFLEQLTRIGTQDLSQFLNRVKTILEREEQIYAAFFPKLQEDLEVRLNALFYRNWKNELLEAVVKSLESGHFDLVRQILAIFSHAGHDRSFQEGFNTYVTRRFDDCKTLGQLLDFLAAFQSWKGRVFEGREALWKEHNIYVENLVNKNNKIEPEFFAKSLNWFVVTRDSQRLQMSLGLLHILAEKEKYVKAIYKFFSKALLGKSHVEVYTRIYEDLRKLYGDEMLKSFKKLIHDIVESGHGLEKVRGQISEKVGDLFIIDRGQWPASALDWKLPERLLERELQASVNRIKQTYYAGNDLKKMDFMADFSTVEMEVGQGTQSKVVHLKLKYALLLTAFEQRPQWSFADLSVHLELAVEPLTRLVKTANKKYGVFDLSDFLVKLRPDWLPNLVANYQKRPSDKGVEKVGVFSQQSAAPVNKADLIKEIDRPIKAFIVREVKTKKLVKLNALVDETSKEFKLPIEAGDIGGLIDDLLNNEFIHRSKEDPNAFEYK